MTIFERMCLRASRRDHGFGQPRAGVARAYDEQPRRRRTRRAGRARVRRLPAPRWCLQPAVGPRERKDHGAGSMVADVRQAPAPAVGHRAACARTARRRFRGRAQLVSLRPDPERQQIAPGAQDCRQSLSSATRRCTSSCVCTGCRVECRRIKRWESDEDSDGSGDESDGDVAEVLQLNEAAVLRLMA
jgi:hypothetical protein